MTRDANMFLGLVKKKFPLLWAKYGGDWKRFLVLGQDFTHVHHRHTRSVSQKKTQDFGNFKSFSLAAFRRTKLPSVSARPVDYEGLYQEWMEAQKREYKGADYPLFKQNLVEQLKRGAHNLSLMAPWDAVVSSLFLFLGEHNLFPLSKALEISLKADGTPHELPRAILKRIAVQCQLQATEFEVVFPRVGYSEPQEILSAVTRIHNWFETPRQQSKTWGFAVAAEIAEMRELHKAAPAESSATPLPRVRSSSRSAAATY